MQVQPDKGPSSVSPSSPTHPLPHLAVSSVLMASPSIPFWPQQASHPNPSWGSTFESRRPHEAAPARLTSRILLWPLCANSLDKPGNCRESHSVVSNSLQPHGLDSPLDSPDQNTGEGSLSLLQGIFPTQGSNPGLPHCRRILYQLSHKGSPRILEWVAITSSRGSSQPRD